MANDTKILVKEELLEPNLLPKRVSNPDSGRSAAVIDLSSSDSDSDSSSSDDDSSAAGRGNNARKKRRKTAEDFNALLPLGFLDPLPSKQAAVPVPVPLASSPPPSERLCLEFPSARINAVVETSVKQFWKAGDYEGAPGGDWDYSNGNMLFFFLLLLCMFLFVLESQVIISIIILWRGNCKRATYNF